MDGSPKTSQSKMSRFFLGATGFAFTPEPEVQKQPSGGASPSYKSIREAKL